MRCNHTSYFQVTGFLRRTCIIPTTPHCLLFGPNIPTAVAFCLGTEVLRHSAGIVGTYDHTYVRNVHMSNHIHSQ